MAPFNMTKIKVREANKALDETKLPSTGTKVDEHRCALRQLLAATHGVGPHADVATFFAHVTGAA
jgi:hypothetical protein